MFMVAMLILNVVVLMVVLMVLVARVVVFVVAQLKARYYSCFVGANMMPGRRMDTSNCCCRIKQPEA
jgi:hypothetical protein